MTRPVTPNATSIERRSTWGCLLAGICAGIVLLKLGAPVIFEHRLSPPADITEILFFSWPVSWGYGVLALATAGSLILLWPVSRMQRRQPATPISSPIKRWVFWLPAAWFGWQCLAAIASIDPTLTLAVLPHFAGCAVCYYFGFYHPVRSVHLRWFWIGLIIGLAMICRQGLDQHFGGLEETRRQLQAMDLAQLPAAWQTEAFRARAASDRIFSTFVYPNAFAGALLLLLPPCLGALLAWRKDWLPAKFKTVGWMPCAIIGVTGLACLYWTGSKSAWLIALGIGLIALMKLDWNRTLKTILLLVLLTGGVGGFFVKYARYFEKGATSMSARFDYWTAAATIAREHPLLGSGPGTFSVLYKKLKPPEAEMARLAHNDYLQQACDSGLIGFLTYTLFILGCLYYSQPRAESTMLKTALWLGLLAWALHGLVEFGLYIPATAWLFFGLAGWLHSASSQNDSAPKV